MGLLDNLLGKNKDTKEETSKIAWTPLTDVSQLEGIENESKNTTVMIFKHSTRCSISSSVLNKFEKQVDGNGKFYFLDLLNYRDISGAIASKFNVMHQSPQLLIFKNGSLNSHSSHYEILESLND